jgi:putative endonuclease
MSKIYYVYILASVRNGTLYVGVTGVVPGFTKKYSVRMLVYFEEFGDIGLAINRETRIKKRKRRWKVALIEKTNLNWFDLYDNVQG